MMRPELRELFDNPPCRENTHCIKWDNRESDYHAKDAIPMWVADMDFRTAPGVIQALVERCEHGAFGYEAHDPRRAESLIGWMDRRHGLKVEPQWLISSPGVVDSLYACVRALSEPGSSVIINEPLYGPFFSAIKSEGRTVFGCPMHQDDQGVWRMDYARIEEGLRQGARLFLLCNPHNPVGRVWTREELMQLHALCSRYGARIVSDEIHCDFIRAGHKHVPMLSVDPDCVQLISSTKTFNLAAMRHSQAIIANEEIRNAVQKEISLRCAGGGIMGPLAQEAAFRTGDEWVDAMNEYLDESREMVETFFAEKLPQFSVTRSQGTYLLWINASCLGLYGNDLVQEFIRRANVIFNPGEFFGDYGKGYVRMNIATSHTILKKALEGLEKAFAQ